MTFILIMYLFLQDGTLIQSRHTGYSTMNDCLHAGARLSEDFWKEYGKQGDVNFICILDRGKK